MNSIIVMDTLFSHTETARGHELERHSSDYNERTARISLPHYQAFCDLKQLDTFVFSLGIFTT